MVITHYTLAVFEIIILMRQMFNPLHNITNQELFEKHLRNQNATMKIHDFCYEGKSSHVAAKLTSFTVSQDELVTKEDTGKEECIVHIAEYKKGISWAKVASNSEKIKPMALAVIEFSLSEAISHSAGSQSVSQPVENSV